MIGVGCSSLKSYRWISFVEPAVLELLDMGKWKQIWLLKIDAKGRFDP